MGAIGFLILICLLVSQGNCKEKEKKDETKEAKDAKSEVGERMLQVLPGSAPGEETPQITNMGSVGQRTPDVPKPQEGPMMLEGQSNIPLLPPMVVDNLRNHPPYMYPPSFPIHPTRRSQINPTRMQRWNQPYTKQILFPRNRRFHRYRGMKTIPEPDVANIGKFGFPLLSHYDEARAPTAEDFKDPIFLLPNCHYHVPGCNKMRYIIDLFTKNITMNIAHKLKGGKFYSRGILLREILQQLMKSDLKGELLNKVKEYAQQMEQQPSAPAMEPVYKDLIYALQEPTSEIEKVTFGQLADWLANTDITLKMGKDYDPYPYKTKSSLLNYVIQQSLATLDVSSSLRDAMEYWNQRIINFGRGTEPVDWKVVVNRVNKTTIDMRSMINVIDQRKMEPGVKTKKLIKDIKEFFEKKFNPEVHMDGFNINKYSTKGQLFIAFVENLLKNSDLSKDVRKNFEAIKPYISLDGPGLEAIESIGRNEYMEKV